VNLHIVAVVTFLVYGDHQKRLDEAVDLNQHESIDSKVVATAILEDSKICTFAMTIYGFLERDECLASERAAQESV
jgi:hypothetical protein